jgi:hypothetical protein
MKVVLGVVILGILLIACSRQNSVISRPVEPVPVMINDSVTETKLKDPCESVRCASNEVCREGKCFCAPDFKACGTACIPQKECCDSSDCEPQNSCIKGSCVRTEFCEYNQKYNVQSGRCECSGFTFYCEDQGKCVPKDHCCSIRECVSSTGSTIKKCTPTSYRLEVCISKGSTKVCSFLDEKKDTKFSLTDTNQKSSEDLFVSSFVYERGLSDVQVKRNNLFKVVEKIEIGKPKSFDDLVIETRSVQEMGGLCKTKE